MVADEIVSLLGCERASAPVSRPVYAIGTCGLISGCCLGFPSSKSSLPPPPPPPAAEKRGLGISLLKSARYEIISRPNPPIIEHAADYHLKGRVRDYLMPMLLSDVAALRTHDQVLTTGDQRLSPVGSMPYLPMFPLFLKASAKLP